MIENWQEIRGGAIRDKGSHPGQNQGCCEYISVYRPTGRKDAPKLQILLRVIVNKHCDWFDSQDTQHASSVTVSWSHHPTSHIGVPWWSLCSPDTLRSEGGSTRCGHYTGTVCTEGSPRSPVGSGNTGAPWPLGHTHTGRSPHGRRRRLSPEGRTRKLKVKSESIRFL